MDRLGDYRLRRRLAVGGMGEVYLGEKVGPEGFVKPVVLKCVLPQLAKDRAFVQLFLDEARLAALLNHQNIAQIYDFGIVDEVYYLSMEYVPGYTVDDVRRKHRSIDKFMPVEHIAGVASQVCAGLHYAHSLTDAKNVSLGLVHRDVSPHNLIISIDGAVKIVDFGIAKARAGLTRVQAKGAVGKFGYMSPEQSRGEQVDPRTDIFSLGICLWELTTNHRLHDAKIDRPPDYHPSRPIPSVSTFRRDIPKTFDRLLQRALSVDRNDRFESCGEMHLELERFLASMTHYAGSAAMAAYIKDLVEGKIENPDESTKGSVVEPVTELSQQAVDRPSKKAVKSEGMEAAQKYEEVFGVNVETTEEQKASREQLRAVPKSWETQSPQKRIVALDSPQKTQAPARPSIQPLQAGTSSIPPGMRDDGNTLELKTGRTPIPGLQIDKRPVKRATAPVTYRKEGGGKAGIYAIVLFILIIGGAVGAWFTLGDQIFAMVGLAPDSTKPQEMAGAYRIVSSPAGSAVYVDSIKQPGVTPLSLALSPGLDYKVELKLAGYATRRIVLKAEVAKTVRELSFKLQPAAKLQLASVPSGAGVSIDGFPLDGVITPVTLDDVPGDQEVRVALSLKGRPALVNTFKIPVGGSLKKVLKFP